VSATELADWRQHTTGAFRLRWWPGGHFYLRYAEADVLKKIGKELEMLRQDDD
jgi:surfactin synthase thioesterase subunit